MGRWTEQGEQLVNNVANRYGTSTDAVSMMLDSLLRGGGTMAQFNINELGGGGQWMRGGMTMVGDMFNYSLKSRVDGICNDLSSAIIEQQMQVVPPPPPNSSGNAQGGWGNWWPSDLGIPNTSGSQNQYRYAYFGGSHRLAISDGQNVSVYDTLDHQIGGVSQQQSGGASVTFTSQYGNVDLRTLPIISGPAANRPAAQSPAPTATPPPQPAPAPPAPIAQQTNQSSPVGATSSSDDVFNMIERLAKLRDSGAISDDDFSAKKTELLGRL